MKNAGRASGTASSRAGRGDNVQVAQHSPTATSDMHRPSPSSYFSVSRRMYLGTSGVKVCGQQVTIQDHAEYAFDTSAVRAKSGAAVSEHVSRQRFHVPLPFRLGAGAPA